MPRKATKVKTFRHSSSWPQITFTRLSESNLPLGSEKQQFLSPLRNSGMSDQSISVG
jgi:hypothetical protein